MIDLNKFTSTDKSRTNILQPWADGEHSYATNARIAVRVPRRIEDAERDDAPNGPAVFAGVPASVAWWPLPALETEEAACKHCVDGKAYDSKPCEECNGDGHTDCCECGQERECEECDGMGTLRVVGAEDCEVCNGTGKWLRCAEIDTPSGRLGYETLDLLAVLDGVELGVPGEFNGLPHHGIAFRATSCEGVVMPIRGEYEECLRLWAGVVKVEGAA